MTLVTRTRADGQSVQCLAHYPAGHPAGSRSLPLTRRREVLTAIDVVANPCLRQALAAQTVYAPSDVLLKITAMGVIHSAVTATTPMLKDFLFTEEQKKAVDILKKLEVQTILRLPELQQTKKVYELVVTILLNWMEEIQLDNQEVIKQPPFVLHPEDFRIAGTDLAVYQANLCVPLCQDFVFYKLNEENAFSHLFRADRKPWPAESESHPIEFLAKWGYDRVDQPLPGDLVLYCSTLKGFLQAKHWGIWTPKSKVLAKGGVGYPLEHPLEDVIVSYGNFVYFFRKRIPCKLLREFLKEVEKNTINDPKAFLDHILTHLKQYQITGVFKESIYNVEYNQELKRKLLYALANLSKELKVDATASTLRADVKKIALQVASEMLPRF